MTVEILFSKLCNQFGDSKNIDFLRLSLPQARFVMTEITDEKPFFADHDVDMLYMGGMSEAAQLRVIHFLKPHTARLEALIDAGTVFLATGNAFEVFTKKIENLTAKTTEDGLGLFDLTTKIDLFARFNGKIMGEVDGVPIVGFKSQFSMVYGDNTGCCFFRAQRGIGINRGTDLEGVRRKNFIGTHILGPILVLNPLFTEYLMGLLGVEHPQCAFRTQAMAAFDRRYAEFKDKKIPF